MAEKKAPSGLPRDRIAGPGYRSGGFPIYDQVGIEHTGVVKVRNSFLAATIAVGLLVVVVAVFGSTDSASGIAVLMLAPVAVFLAIAQAAVWATRPKPSRVNPTDT